MSKLKRQNPYVRLVFLFAFFALSIGDAFNVLFIRQMAENVSNGSNLELLTSLPVTCMSAMMIGGVVFSNFIVRKSGNIISFVRISIIFTAAGMLLRSLAFHYLVMLLGFMASGFGYGCFYIAIRYYAYLFSDDKERLESMAQINGGAFAGQCMGTVLGGIMAGQMSYRAVYLISLVILIIPFFLTAQIDIKDKVTVGNILSSFRVLKNPKSVIFLIFMVIPIFACTIFTSYTVPLATDSFGYSSTVISAMLLAAYMITAYAGPAVTGFISKKMSAMKATYIYSSGIAMMIAVFSIGQRFMILVPVVMMLGLLDAFGPNVMTEAYTTFRGDDGNTASDALMIFILTTRVGMTLAPMVIAFFGSSIALSGAVLTGMALFLLSGTMINVLSSEK